MSSSSLHMRLCTPLSSIRHAHTSHEVFTSKRRSRCPHHQLQATAPVKCFGTSSDTLGDIMRGAATPDPRALNSESSSSGGWLSWPFKGEPDPAISKIKVRQAKVQRFRAALSASRKTKPIELPPSSKRGGSFDEETQQENQAVSDAAIQRDGANKPSGGSPSSTAAAVAQAPPALAPAVPWPNALSNAVPFNASCIDSMARDPGLDMPTMPRATVVNQVLPWLFAAPGSVGKHP